MHSLSHAHIRWGFSFEKWQKGTPPLPPPGGGGSFLGVFKAFWGMANQPKGI